MAYPKDYKPVHLREEILLELDEIEDFGDIGRQEKIRQLIRFYKAKKEIVV